MVKPVQKTEAENLDEMLKRIRLENQALRRLIEAVKNLPLNPVKSKTDTNQ